MRKRKAPVLKLVTAADEQRQSAIEVLEDILERAKAGEIEQVGIAFVKRGNAVNTVHSDCNAGELLGACTLLVHRLATGCDK